MHFGPNDPGDLSLAPYSRNAFSVSSFRTVGDAGADWNVFTLHVPTASTTLAAMVLQCDASFLVSSALVGGDYQIASGRVIAIPTGGTSLATRICPAKTGVTAGAVPLGATASHGGVATAITLAAMTLVHKAGIIPNIPNGVTLANGVSMPISTMGLLNHPLTLVAGEAFCVQAPQGIDTLYGVVVNVTWVETKA